MSEPDSPKPIPTLQTALFVGAWLTSWWSLLKNSILMFHAPKDVVIVAPAVILLLGLILTNVQGYFDEKAREEFTVAKAAAVDGDLLVLLHRDGKRICSGKPTKAWRRLQVRQALGRGIPLSMVSFYLASRSVIEEPICQLSARLSREILEHNTTGTCKLTEALADQKRICRFDLPFGFGLGCQSSEELNQTGLLAEIREESTLGFGDKEIFEAPLKGAEEEIWKSGHCSASTWRLQPNNKGQKGNCAYEACLVAEAPSGPSKVFNEQLYQLLLKGAKDSKELKRSVKHLVRDWNRKEAFAVGLNVETSLEHSNAHNTYDQWKHGCSDHIHKELADGFPPRFHFLGGFDVAVGQSGPGEEALEIPHRQDPNLDPFCHWHSPCRVRCCWDHNVAVHSQIRCWNY